MKSLWGKVERNKIRWYRARIREAGSLDEAKGIFESVYHDLIHENEKTNNLFQEEVLEKLNRLIEK